PAAASLPAVSLHDALPIFRLRGGAELFGVRILAGERRAVAQVVGIGIRLVTQALAHVLGVFQPFGIVLAGHRLLRAGKRDLVLQDRKSTRLNSSHVTISYA